MSKPTQLAIFASGNGSNLQAIIDETKAGHIPAHIRLVFSDRKSAFALERGRNAGIETMHLAPKEYDTREEYDRAIIQILRDKEIDWVVLAGFMRILSPDFVHAYKGRIINIHPALLPKYPGTHSIERAFQNKEPVIGVTVHYVDEGVDTGPIILQDSISISKSESLEEVTQRVHQLEHRLYPEALRKVLS